MNYDKGRCSLLLRRGATALVSLVLLLLSAAARQPPL